jgi:hypothetical protein
MIVTTVARYERPSTIWKNARSDKRTYHFVEMLCEVIDYDAPSETELKYGFAPSKVINNDTGKQIHKVYKVQCKGVNGKWTVLGLFDDDKSSANQLVKSILNDPWYKGWKRVS